MLAGEWKLGFGETYDPARLQTFPAGSLYHLPAKVPHYQATGSAETIIEIHAVGPSTTDFLNPLDDPRESSTAHRLAKSHSNGGTERASRVADGHLRRGRS